jgi:hypothetical protein
MQRRIRKSEKRDDVAAFRFSTTKTTRQQHDITTKHIRDLFSQKWINMQFTEPKHAAKHHAQHCFWHKTSCQKQPKRGPGQRHARPTCDIVPHELSTPQGERASPKPLPHKTFEIPNGADNLCNKNKRKPKRKPIRKFPTCLAISAMT